MDGHNECLIYIFPFYQRLKKWMPSWFTAGMGPRLPIRKWKNAKRWLRISTSLDKIKLYEQTEENRRLNQDILKTIQEGIQLIDQQRKVI
ncbi:hypothetical protein P4647_12525 [Peribacillus frigoritolerans]|uniref:hypothetical protein n=1 Tax=Peribacillus frigoritolerans TaxID=450367 RepID=UPI002E2464FE|nr:hypothetical protein [Peribacillus frigoritolerans]